MQRLTQAPNAALAMLWADLLCEAGMPASVQRQYLGAAAGHLPPHECLPEIWLSMASTWTQRAICWSSCKTCRSACGTAPAAASGWRAGLSSAGTAER